MIRPNTDWFSSTRDDSNPFFEDEIRPTQYTSECARLMFRAFRYLCLFILYIVLLFAVLFSVLALYGVAHFASFKDSLMECFGRDLKTAEDFRRHHPFRLALQMTYGLSATAFALTATRLSKFNTFAKVGLTVVGILICVVCIVGDVQEAAWPLPLRDLNSCGVDRYIVWLYRSWPWYTSTLTCFIIFTGVKWLEAAKFIKRDED